MQRRRKPRAKPRDVFSSSPPVPSKTSKNIPPKDSKKPMAKPPAKPSPSKQSAKITTTNPTSKNKDPEDITNQELDKSIDITQSNILGESRKTIGLRSKTKSSDPETKDNATSQRAQDIIDKSRARAMESLVKKAKTDVAKDKPTVTTTPKRRGRRTKNSFQPAERKRRLDRSRHMEYKYEVRRLLVELNVDEEHRSSLLGTIWAKGERQTVTDAKEFLISKHSEGVIDEGQLETLSKIVDSYTVRR